MIAHRLHTIMHADRIHVIEDGAVVESGRHEELLRKGGRYASFYRLQLQAGAPAQRRAPSAGRPRSPHGRPVYAHAASRATMPDRNRSRTGRLHERRHSYVIPPAAAGRDRGRRQRASVSGAPHLVRRAQLPRAHPRDGPGRARAAVLLRQARRRDRAGRRHGAVPAADQGPAFRGRAGGRAQERRPQHHDRRARSTASGATASAST